MMSLHALLFEMEEEAEDKEEEGEEEGETVVATLPSSSRPT